MAKTAAVAVATVVALAGAVVTAAPATAADRDCGDFASQKSAQIFFLKHGGPQSDPHGLDDDGDGIACESNPAPYYYGTNLPGGGGGGGGGNPDPVKRDKARVVEVIDGDTVRVKFDGRRKVVRMLGLDTPEVYGGAECGGKLVSKSARKLLPRGKKVILISDPSQDNKDRYGRLLRYVERKGNDVSKAQINRGWAKTYVYANNPFKRVKPYKAAQQRAKKADRGVWDLCGGRFHKPL